MFHADLRGAKLHGADLRGAHLSGADFRDADLRMADLRSAECSRANFLGAKLRGANLHRALLVDTNLRGADLSGANLAYAELRRADLSRADLSGADLRGAWLSEVILAQAKLSGARVGDATFERTTFGGTDLGDAIGLGSCLHRGPSYLDLYTIIACRGKLPLSFLRGVGVSDDLIAYLPALVGGGIELYSCFISYASEDHPFVQRLHADLQDKGIRCWFAPHDLPIGAKTRLEIDGAIRLHEKLLLILSAASISSHWVEGEVETALERERNEKGTVLFPLRLDDAIMASPAGWPKLIKNTRNICDFSRWKDHDAYQMALKRVVRDLRKIAGPT